MSGSFPRMLQEDAENQFRHFQENRTSFWAKGFTKKKAAAFAKQARAYYKKIFSFHRYFVNGKKSPLRTEITGTLDFENYSIQKIVFESRPGFFVTAHRYLPKKNGPLPGAVISCGHAEIGKAYPDYQALSTRLAIGGFAVIIYDPIAQGERVEFESPGKSCVREHIMSGKRKLLLGDHQAAAMAWDGIRALDCLLELPMVDKTRLAALGQSGGGTLTSLLLALDDRYAFGAPSCFITDFQSNLENEIPCDSEQIPTGAIQKGLDLYDLLSAAAPRPILIAARNNDFFDLRGTRRAFAFLKKLYGAFSKSSNIQLFTSPGSHGIDAPSRAAVGDFLFKKAGLRSVVREEDIRILGEEECRVLPRGSVVKDRNSLTSMDLDKTFLLEAKKSRRAFQPEVFKKLLVLPNLPSKEPEIRVLRPHNISGRPFSRYAVATERSAFALVKAFTPEPPGTLFQFPTGSKPDDTARVFVGQLGLEAELASVHGGVEQLKNLFSLRDPNFFSVDVRGFGDSTPDTTDQTSNWSSHYGWDYFYASWAQLFGKTLMGGRVFDLLRVLQLLKTKGFSQIELYGSGLGGLTSLFAAPYIAGLSRLSLWQMPASFEWLYLHPSSRLPTSSVVPGLLLHSDIPEIVDSLRKKIKVEIFSEMDLGLKP